MTDNPMGEPCRSMTEQAHLTILGLCGSLRGKSFNRGLLLAAQELLPHGVSLEIADLRGVPEFDEDLELAGQIPPQVIEIKARIAAADVLLVATPEYNYGLPGWFKNVIDWVSRPVATTPFIHKPVGVVGASAGERGAARGQMALRQALLPNDAYVMGRPEVFVGRAAAKYDADGRLVDEPTRRELRQFLIALVAWTRLVTGDVEDQPRL